MALPEAGAQKNLALFLVSKGHLEIRECPIPNPPQRGEVVIALDFVGICGSDLSLIAKGELGSWKLDPAHPVVLGHEPCGTIIKKGEGVDDLDVGDRVALEHQMPDMSCEYCKSGRYNLCPNADSHTIGFPPTHGAIRRFMKHLAKWCYRIPGNVPIEWGALVQPLAVAIHACNRANLRGGSTILVTGAGPIGLFVVQAAKAFAAARVVVTDIINEKLQLAKELGADETVNSKEQPDGGLAAVYKALGDRRADITIECTGAAPAISLAIHCTMSGGKVVLCGIGPKKQEIPLVDASLREVDLLGVCRFANCYHMALQLMSAGKLPHIGKMITHTFPLEKATDAIKTLQDLKGPDDKVPVKVLIKCNKN